MNQFFKRFTGFCLLFFAIQFSSKATHAIGGDLKMTWLGGTIYRITYNLYVNVLSANEHNLELEPNLPAGIYEAGSGQLVSRHDLYLVGNYTVSSPIDKCTPLGYVKTNLLTYSAEVNLINYTAPGGYVAALEYCCRNQELNNVASPSDIEFALYTVFPASTMVNSSPAFKPLNNQYFCTNTFNTFDFSATDADGDSLVYSLTDPLQSIIGNRLVVPWTTNHSGANPFLGSPGLSVDHKTGLLSFKSIENGIFLFSVKVEEYRNKQKIGEVRRDYQFIFQPCIENAKPSIGFKDIGLKETDTLSVLLKEEKCIPLFFTDPDALTRTEYLYTTVDGGGYNRSGIGLAPAISVDALNDTVFSNLCFKPCLLNNIKTSGYYPISIVVNNNRCPDKFDTLVFTLHVIVPENAIPTVSIDPSTNPKRIKVDSPVRFNVLGMDADPDDLLSLRIFSKKSTMSFQNVFDSTSTISSEFSWTPSCEDLNPGTYTVYFIVRDNSCIAGHADTVYQQLIIEDNLISFDSMQVTNLVTPNGDHKNDYYHIPGIPAGNCMYFFKHISIYNRWGSKVFYSEDKNFKWHPEVSDGIYYFDVDLNEAKRSGWIQVVTGN